MAVLLVGLAVAQSPAPSPALTLQVPLAVALAVAFAAGFRPVSSLRPRRLSPVAPGVVSHHGRPLRRRSRRRRPPRPLLGTVAPSATELASPVRWRSAPSSLSPALSPAHTPSPLPSPSISPKASPSPSPTASAPSPPSGPVALAVVSRPGARAWISAVDRDVAGHGSRSCGRRGRK
ncbi:LIM domain-binding protein 3-like [Eucalyptus grandis]|uniref:LIM domain-binding protein 3-like n=1 Tax=Eucalyptus grandis TaxID=71139 RepID=UPI00192EC1BE|nr:LIM domain-binding protein 3-like [Eucalyptus grandis]